MVMQMPVWLSPCTLLQRGTAGGHELQCRAPAELPAPPQPAPSTQTQPGKVQSTELAHSVTEEGPIPHPKGHPFPGGGGQEGETEAQLNESAKNPGWEGLTRARVLRPGYQPSARLPQVERGTGRGGRALGEGSPPCRSFPAGSPPFPREPRGCLRAVASAAGDEGRMELDFTGKINLEFIIGVP